MITDRNLIDSFPGLNFTADLLKISAEILPINYQLNPLDVFLEYVGKVL